MKISLTPLVYSESTVEEMKLRIKSVIWNIRKQKKKTTTNKNSKKKKESTPGWCGSVG